MISQSKNIPSASIMLDFPASFFPIKTVRSSIGNSDLFFKWSKALYGN